MTSAYLTELRQRLGVTRDRLDEELRKVPVDYTKAALYERQIEDLREDLRSCSTSGGELLLSYCSSFSQTLSVQHRASVTQMQLPTAHCTRGVVCLAHAWQLCSDKRLMVQSVCSQPS